MKKKRRLPKPFYFVKDTDKGFRVFGSETIGCRSRDEETSFETYGAVWKTNSPAQAFAVADYLNQHPEKLVLFRTCKIDKQKELLKQMSLGES